MKVTIDDLTGNKDYQKDIIDACKKMKDFAVRLQKSPLEQLDCRTQSAKVSISSFDYSSSVTMCVNFPDHKTPNNTTGLRFFFKIYMGEPDTIWVGGPEEFWILEIPK